MAYLKIYRWEHETYPEFLKVEVSKSHAEIYFRKLARHFKVEEPRIDWLVQKRRRGAYNSGWIMMPNKSSLGLVIHEFAHHLTRTRYGHHHGHDRKFKRCLKICYTFAKRYLPKS